MGFPHFQLKVGEAHSFFKLILFIFGLRLFFSRPDYAISQDRLSFGLAFQISWLMQRVP